MDPTRQRQPIVRHPVLGGQLQGQAAAGSARQALRKVRSLPWIQPLTVLGNANVEHRLSPDGKVAAVSREGIVDAITSRGFLGRHGKPRARIDDANHAARGAGVRRPRLAATEGVWEGGQGGDTGQGSKAPQAQHRLTTTRPTSAGLRAHVGASTHPQADPPRKPRAAKKPPS